MYLVYPYVFDKEIAKGFDRAKVVQVLKAAGMLKVPDTKDNRPCTAHRVPSDIDPKATTTKRLYEFVSVTRPEDDTDPAPIPTDPASVPLTACVMAANNAPDTPAPETTTPDTTTSTTSEYPAHQHGDAPTRPQPPLQATTDPMAGMGSPPAMPQPAQRTTAHNGQQDIDPPPQGLRAGHDPHNDPPD